MNIANSNANESYTYHPLWLTFKSKKHEQQFRMRYFSKSVKAFRIAFITVILLYSAFGIFDFMVAKNHIGYFFIIRYLIVLPLLSAILLLSFNRQFKKYWQLLLFLAFFVSGSGIIHMLAEIPNNMFYYGGLFLVFMAGYFFIKLRFLLASAAGIILMAIFNILVGTTEAMDDTYNYLLISNAFYISANIIGAMAAYNIELLERKDFILNKQISDREHNIKQINSNLEKIISERTESLKHKNAKLEEEIENRRKLEQYLVKTKEKALESDRLKTAFLNNISHEFHTPMNGIIGFSGLLAESCPDNSDTDRYSEYIRQSCERLLEIVSDTIEISKVQSRSIRLIKRPENVAELMEKQAQTAKGKAKKKGLVFEYINTCSDNNCYILHDKQKLTNSLRHIIDNAVKFTKEGFVKLSLHCTANRVLEITVEDSGIGVSDTMKAVIFDPFRQSETLLSKNPGGNGIGLTLAKAYTEMAGGELILKSKPGVGTKITLRFPAQPASIISEKKISVIGQPAGILIVHSKLAVRENISKVFEKIGVETYVTQRTNEAIDMCRNRKEIDLILIEEELANQQAYETGKLIKQFRPEIPMIALVETKELKNKEELLIYLFDESIEAPYNTEDLYYLAEKYL